MPALTRITQRHSLDACQLVQEGRIFDLGAELDTRFSPQPSPDELASYRLTPYHTPAALTSTTEPPWSDFASELIQASVHVGTHIDGLAHIQSRGRVFGGALARHVYSDSGWLRNGIEQSGPIVGRGILLDIPLALGQAVLEDGFEITPDHVGAALEQQNSKIRSGDTVLVRTGKFREYADGKDEFYLNQPGVGTAASISLFDAGMALLGTDTSGTEPIPRVNSEESTHVEMIVKRGVMLLEAMDLEELASHRIYEFLFVCLPLKLVGATGSWVRPIAVV